MTFIRTPFVRIFSLAALATLAGASCPAKNIMPYARTQAIEAGPAAGPADAVDLTPLATSDKEAAGDTWARIKDLAWPQHADFIAGYRQLEVDADAQIQKLDAKRATLSDLDAKDWDIAFKELRDARTDLDDKLTQLKEANVDTWNDAKDKATAAWQRVTDDFDKVKSTTTP
jgi:hypothetical protein